MYLRGGSGVGADVVIASSTDAAGFKMASTGAVTLPISLTVGGAIVGNTTATITGALVASSQLTSRGIITSKQASPTALTTSATLTGAQILVGALTANQGAGAAAVYTLPTATDFQTALGATVVTANDDSFEFSLIDTSTNVLETATIATNAGWTLVGNMQVQANSAVTANSAGQFRARRTASNTYTLYRLS